MNIQDLGFVRIQLQYKEDLGMNMQNPWIPLQDSAKVHSGMNIQDLGSLLTFS